jgi:hypothetical protein
LRYDSIAEFHAKPVTRDSDAKIVPKNTAMNLNIIIVYLSKRVYFGKGSIGSAIKPTPIMGVGL